MISPRVVCPPATGWRRRSRLLVCGDARSWCVLTPCVFGPMKQVKNIAHSGNLSLNDVIAIARIMRPRSMARELKGTVKEILGTCQSVGCTIDGCSAPDMLSKVSARLHFRGQRFCLLSRRRHRAPHNHSREPPIYRFPHPARASSPHCALQRCV